MRLEARSAHLNLLAQLPNSLASLDRESLSAGSIPDRERWSASKFLNMFPANLHARSVPMRSIFFAAVCSEAGKYALANPSAATVPKIPELLNVSLPESLRVTTMRCAEYFTLPQKLGRFCG